MTSNQKNLPAFNGLSSSELSALEQTLQSLLDCDDAIWNVSISTMDGFELLQRSCAGRNQSKKLAAMTSSLSALGLAVNQELRLGLSESVLIDSTEGRLLLLSSKPGEMRAFILGLVVGKQVLLGRALLLARECVARLTPILNPALPQRA